MRSSMASAKRRDGSRPHPQGMIGGSARRALFPGEGLWMIT